MLLGLSTFYLTRGEFQAAQEPGDHLLRLAQQQQDPAHLMEVHRRRGIALFHLGQFNTARDHLEQAMALYDSQLHGSQVFVYGWVDAGVSALGYDAYALWFLG